MRVKQSLEESIVEMPGSAALRGPFLELFGGAPCLDFANTLDGRATAHPEEKLATYTDLVGWAHYAGLIDPSAADRLTATTPPAARAALATAVELREAIFQVFAAVARSEPVPAEALTAVRNRYAEAVAVARLQPGEAGFEWEFSGDSAHRPWWPVAVSAVRLLTAGPLDRVKVCAARAGCIGLFLDVSKNHSRRWCNDGCSIEAKIQRQAQRRRTARTGR
jgi:predicted RNA-binding Zn ribbon-like protein